MQKILLAGTLAVCGLTIEPALHSSSLIAHQQHQAVPSDSSGISVMIHLDPDDTPHAGHASETWFMLMQSDGSVISPSDCDCGARVYDTQGEMVFHHLPLSSTWVNGYEAIGTSITFPTPGAYTVVLSGESVNNSFEPFEIEFPVTAVVPPTSD
ncbi:hypothetical protein [Egbenema bharatensis]|uniref:hypothetical protein n=1 Tax=Egbenema bharatensis TaxID=3463334 RepID=UPI003A862FA1